jgi:hypothetical protein
MSYNASYVQWSEVGQQWPSGHTKARIAIDRRINRIELGNFGDHKFCVTEYGSCVSTSGQDTGCTTLLPEAKWSCCSAIAVYVRGPRALHVLRRLQQILLSLNSLTYCVY